jgi:hypothetical protein
MEPERLTVPCGTCASNIGIGDEFCTGCGRAVADVDRALLRSRLETSDYAAVRASLASSDYVAHARVRNVGSAANWIGLIASLFVLGGALSFAAQRAEMATNLVNLRPLADNAILAPVNGKTYTAGELRAQLQREPYLTLGLNLGVAALMGGLWWWAKRAPLPAIACALALFVAVQVGSALMDPATIAEGLIIKILAMVALGKGLSAALAARAPRHRPSS